MLEIVSNYLKYLRKFSFILGLSLLVSWLGISSFFALSPIDFLKQGARVLVAPIYSFAYRGDMNYVENVTKKYRVGFSGRLVGSPAVSWKRVENSIPGFRLLDNNQESLEESEYLNPFIYENPNADYLQKFRLKYHLDAVIRDSHDEYDAMLRLGAWLGTRWDHGTDEVPGGNTVCDPVAVVSAGDRGAKFWCEIAAKTTVHAATALGWPARLVTASRDGYTWEHAVTELWSNQFNKWFVMDTDFNVVYESSGVPLSAFELVQSGEQLQRNGQLKVRTIAEHKKSLSSIDLIPFYNYIHIDMRSDWCSRPLRPGSPAGGDSATWWTARPTLKRLLTAKVRVDQAATFDWKVNSVAIYAIRAKRLGEHQLLLEVGLEGYGPTFGTFELSIDEGPWIRLQEAAHTFSVAGGVHTIKARLSTTLGHLGPVSWIKFEVAS